MHLTFPLQLIAESVSSFRLWSFFSSDFSFVFVSLCYCSPFIYRYLYKIYFQKFCFLALGLSDFFLLICYRFYIYLFINNNLGCTKLFFSLRFYLFVLVVVVMCFLFFPPLISFLFLSSWDRLNLEREKKCRSMADLENLQRSELENGKEDQFIYK
jgi:hypothetical protein